MKAREIVKEYIENYGIDDYVDFIIYEDDLETTFSRKGIVSYKIESKNELIKLKAILELMELDYEVV